MFPLPLLSFIVCSEYPTRRRAHQNEPTRFPPNASMQRGGGPTGLWGRLPQQTTRAGGVAGCGKRFPRMDGVQTRDGPAASWGKAASADDSGWRRGRGPNASRRNDAIQREASRADSGEPAAADGLAGGCGRREIGFPRMDAVPRGTGRQDRAGRTTAADGPGWWGEPNPRALSPSTPPRPRPCCAPSATFCRTTRTPPRRNQAPSVRPPSSSLPRCARAAGGEVRCRDGWPALARPGRRR
jgi:hypothetical protein